MSESPAPGEARDTSRSSTDLESLRGELERVDRLLISMLVERYRLAEAVGQVKRAAGLPVVDPAQEASVLRRIGALARAAGLGEEEVRQIFWRIIDLSRGAQHRLAG
jgi:chorismate mutase